MTVGPARAERASAPYFKIKMSNLFSFFVIFLCFKSVLTQRNGDLCNQNGVPGRCLRLRDCASAVNSPSTRRSLQRCGFDGREPIVCCLDKSSGSPVATPASVQSTTTEYVPPLADYSDVRAGGGTCAPISAKLTAQKTGRKAWDKCIEYQEQLLYPCERGVDFLGKLSRGNYCNHKVDELIVGGKEAKRDEFPHMALLGFENPSPDDPICGGTVISDKFILTAGHCTYTKGSKVSTAKVGLLRRTENVPASNIYGISRIIKHPQYKPPSKYNDIALLQTDRQIQFGHTVIPACLDTGESGDASRASVTGWGDTAYLGSKADALLKVTLMKFESSECLRRYKVGQRHLEGGFNEASQLCYGDHTEAKDTCQGDSGGPLQIHNSRVHCMYSVVGLTSFGWHCGRIGFPGIYTRVDAFTPWIESVVWP
ncbi:clotting factor B-like isoform X2 [Choristoneura fumiferana]|uniref:clotting factor B-like isoform X2 n=1 Tax=Choristoneura fumiferana TaxID=7141 RepID=UPI003D159F45